ncbi:MAG: cytochrome c biogenesis protein CcsA [Actinomycetota bacterium]
MSGGLLLGAAALAAFASAVSATGLTGDDRRRLDHRLLVLGVVLLWAAVARLLVAIIDLDTGFAYVAAQTRPGASLPLRVSALWSGAEGSLLFFTAIAVSVLLVGHRAAPRWQRVGVGLVACGLVLTSWRAADPFERLDLPPLSGAGMAPILEHYAMVIHPPALYLGMCGALTPALVREPRIAHRLGQAALTVLTVALALGSSWAYVELGWGGWWAWDPIENVALIVWLLLVAAMHWRRTDPSTLIGHGPLSATVLWALCWPAVLGGTALTRTSLRTSVHAFADAAGLADWLWPLVVLVSIGALWRIRESRQQVMAERAAGTGDGLVALRAEPATAAGLIVARLPAAVLVVAGVIIAAGTYRPFVDGDGTAGFFYSRTLFPVAIGGALLLAAVPLWRPAEPLGLLSARTAQWGLPTATLLTAATSLAGWRTWYQLMLAVAIGFALGPVVASGRRNTARLFGHLGMLLILFAALAGTASTESNIRVVPGEVGTIDGHRIELLSTDLVSESPLQAAATVRIDDRYELTPSVTVYPERALRLPEVSTRTRPWLDTQVVLRDVHPTEGALFTVLFRPWNQLVWWGAGFLAAATGLLLGTSRPLQAGNQRTADPVDGRRT